MSGQNEFGTPARGFQCRRHKSCFSPGGAGKDKFAIANAHAVQILGIVQAEEPILHLFRSREFAEEKRQMSASALNSARSIKFRKESNQHGLSMTNRPQSAQVPAVSLFAT